MSRDAYKIYEGTAPYLFISYSHQDAKQVEPIIRGLQEMGYRVWYDTGIAVGGRWPDIIAEHVMKSSCVIAFLSRNAMKSDYCQEEIFFALEERRPIVPVYLEETVLTPGLRMRLNIRQAIYRNQFHTNADFLAKLTSEAYVKPSLSNPVQTVVPPQPALPDDDFDLILNLFSTMPNKPKSEPSIEYHDELLIPAVDLVLECQSAYISLLQRRLRIGFARSARLMDKMEELGFVGPSMGAKPRIIRITPTQWESTKKRMKLVADE